MTEDEARTIKASLRRKLSGVDNAGDVAVINRKLKFTPWSLSPEDAQFLESRKFSIEEIARWFGVPPFQLMQTEKSTSWGSGIAEQNLGLGRHTLNPWAVRLEQRLTRLLPGGGRVAEFDFASLERPSPSDEINLLISQVREGLITVNEARAVRRLPRIEGGDVLRAETPAAAAAVEEEVPAGG